MQIRIHRLALAEYRRAIARYRRQDVDVAARFVNAVENGAERIEDDPYIGTPCFGSYSWLRVKNFKYLLFYRQVTDSLIMIYAAAHGSRRPGYWIRRIVRP